MSDQELAAELDRRRLEQKTRAAVDRAKAEGATSEGMGGGRAEASSAPPDVAGPGFLADLSPQRRRELRQFYANLELPFGASRDEVKQSYRRLMRQYHPDKFPDDPARKQLATKLSQKLTRAYNDLNRVLREADE